MDCETARQHFEEHLFGELSADGAALLETHLASCAACRAAFARQESVHDALAGERTAVPGGFTDGVMAALAAAKVRKRPRIIGRIAAAAILVLSLLGGLVLAPELAESRTSVVAALTTVGEGLDREALSAQVASLRETKISDVPETTYEFVSDAARDSLGRVSSMRIPVSGITLTGLALAALLAIALNLMFISGTRRKGSDA